MRIQARLAHRVRELSTYKPRRQRAQGCNFVEITGVINQMRPRVSNKCWSVYNVVARHSTTLSAQQETDRKIDPAFVAYPRRSR